MAGALQGYILNCYFSLYPLQLTEPLYSFCILASKASSPFFYFILLYHFDVFNSASFLLDSLQSSKMSHLKQIKSHIAKDIPFAFIAKV